jgi:hypothetical protein
MMIVHQADPFYHHHNVVIKHEDEDGWYSAHHKPS